MVGSELVWAAEGLAATDGHTDSPVSLFPQHKHSNTRAQVELILWDGYCHGEFLLTPCLHGPLAKAVRRQEKALGLASPSPSPSS